MSLLDDLRAYGEASGRCIVFPGDLWPPAACASWFEFASSDLERRGAGTLAARCRAVAIVLYDVAAIGSSAETCAELSRNAERLRRVDDVAPVPHVSWLSVQAGQADRIAEACGFVLDSTWVSLTETQRTHVQAREFRYAGAASAYLEAALLLRERPEIVCLCGSTRFYKAFERANYELSLAGKIVLTVAFYNHSSEAAHGESWGITPEQKIALDDLHKRKIDLADRVFVLNVGGYVGESTRSEIEYARARGKPVDFLEPES